MRSTTGRCGRCRPQVSDAAGRQTSCPGGLRLDPSGWARRVDRPYHPNYTHTNFRGWYEFGGGSIADMGHYSLWPIFQLLELDSPISVESTPSHVCTVSDGDLPANKEDYSFPAACTIRMRFAAKGERPALDLFLVRRRHQAAGARRTHVGEQGTAGRRHDVRWRQGKDCRGLPR